jgi:predicted TIM-barrel fold metal-dependent hydrolase
MTIADAQVHIWGADTPDRPWPKIGHSYAHRDTPLGTAELVAEMDAAGVDKAVIVPPSWEGDRNDLAQEACRLHPGRFAIMGRVPVKPVAPETLKTWRDQPGFLGLRFTVRPEHTWLKDGDGDWAFAAAEQFGLPVMISCVGSLPLVAKLADRFPNLKLVIDHLALRRVKDDAAFADLPDLLALASRPNVAAKASALPCFSSDPYPYRNIHGYIRRVFDAFGPQRMFWGTDLSRLPCTYRQAVTMFTEELPFLSADDKAWVMGKGLCAWLGWTDHQANAGGQA